MISAVPTALAHVLASPGTAAQAPVVALCGEALTGQVVTTIRSTVPGARTINIYGPTETTVYHTTYTLDDAGKPACSPPIGRPRGIGERSCSMTGWGWCRPEWPGSCT